MENAEVYMLLLRKTTLAPVFGEAMYGDLSPFTGQVVIDGWSWNMSNEKRATAPKSQELRERERKLKELRKTKKATEDRARHLKKIAVLNDYAQSMGRKENVDEAMRALGKAAKEVKAIKEMDKKRNDSSDPDDDDDDDWDDDSGKLKFSFQKRLCTASTQMLDMMKGGVPFEKAIVTVVHRAGIWPKMPGFLTIAFSNLLLTKYDLSVSQDNSNTELTEEWEAEFTHVMFEYSKRIDPLKASDVASVGGKIPFIMRPRSL